MRAPFLVLAAALLAPPLLAPATAAADLFGDTAREVAKAAFTQAEREVIRDYYRKHGMPAGEERDRREYEHEGHGKKEKHGGPPFKHGNGKGNKGLPPGIAKKLERGGTLPPGIAKRDLPRDLERRLPPVRAGYERRVVDGKVVLVNTATQVVTDIITDLLNR